VHIADGTTMTPDGYRLRRGPPAILERFDSPAVIGAMSPALRVQYVRALAQGGVKQAQEILSKAADSMIRERLLISVESYEEINQVMTNPLRGGRISPFIRSGGAPIVPGSSVKGTLRTAWLANEARSHDWAALKKKIEESQPGRTGALSNEMQLAAFNCEKNRTEQDPLRDISVSDAQLERECTVIDRVHVANCTREGPIAIGQEGKMQIHVERLASIADARAFPAKPFKIAIGAPDQAVLTERDCHAGTRNVKPSRSPGLDELRKATNAHHLAIWFYERQRFYRGIGTDRLMDELLKVFGFPAQREVSEHTLDVAGAWLLKLGRYAHFESKAVEVDSRRWGEKASRKGHPAEFMSEGGSRTIARDGNGRFLPFGWVLLLPEASAPNEIPHLNPISQVGTRLSERGPASTRAAFAPAQVRFRKGDRVTDGEEEATVLHDVGFADPKMGVEFDGGDIDEVLVEGWMKIS
jgi:hypothetical protein